MVKGKKTKRQQAFIIYLKHEGKIDLARIAKLLDSPAGTIRGWKSKDKWEGKLDEYLLKDTWNAERSNQGGAPLGSQNALGNSGGRPALGNKNAVTHGLFAKWLPSETQEIMDLIEERSEADLLWDSIMFQYVAIIRAQKLMYVNSKDEIIKVLKKETHGENWSKEWEYHFSWDRHATFLNAHSRALNTLSSLLKQFSILIDEADHRAKKLVLMQAQIDEIKGKGTEGENRDWRLLLTEVENESYGEVPLF